MKKNEENKVPDKSITRIVSFISSLLQTKPTNSLSGEAFTEKKKNKKEEEEDVNEEEGEVTRKMTRRKMNK